MEMHERIRVLRKDNLHMSQAEFGDRLGVSRSVINNIERNALARPDQKLSLIKLMCKEFNVNEEWLLNGTEPMYIEPETFSLDDFVKQKGATELELDIVKAYFEIDPDTRKLLVQHFKQRLTSPAEQPGTQEKPLTVEEAEAAYIKSNSSSAPKTGFPASSSTAGTQNNSSDENGAEVEAAGQ